jgi:hypothetical protein
MFESEIKTLGDKVDIKTWLYEGGLPADAAPATSTRAAAIEKLATTGGEVDATTWVTLDWVVYLRALPEQVPAARLKALDERYQLTQTRNAEIAMHWLPLVVRADLRDAAPAVEAFLLRVGRIRMVRPLYTAMMGGSEFWRSLAKTTYARAKPKYHPLTRSSVDSIVK